MHPCLTLKQTGTACAAQQHLVPYNLNGPV